MVEEFEEKVYTVLRIKDVVNRGRKIEGIRERERE